MMVSRKLQKAAHLTPDQLAALLESFHQLAYINPLLLGHLGAVAAEGRVCSYTPAQLAAVVVGYQRLGFHQPQLLQAAATRLLQLTTALPAGQPAAAAAEQQQGSHAGAGRSADDGDDQQWHQLGYLVEAALHLGLMPSAAGSSAERAVLPAAMLGLAAHALPLCTQHQHLKQQQPQQQQPQQHSHGLRLSLSLTNSSSSSSSSLQVMLLLRVALLLCVSTHCIPSPAASAAATAAGVGAAEPGNSQQQHPAAAVTAGAATAAAAVGAASATLGSAQQQALSRLSEVAQQLDLLQQQVQRELQQQLVAAVGADEAAAEQGLGICPGLLCCMQLLWLSEKSSSSAAAAAAASLDHQAAAGSGGAAGGLASRPEQQQQQQQEQQAEAQRQTWRLGLRESLTDALVQQQRQQLNQQLQLERQANSRPVLHAVASAVSRVLQTTAVVQQQQLEVQQVRVMYAVPGSPVLLPVAVLPAAASADGSAADWTAPNPQHQPYRQPLTGGTAGVFLCVQVALQQRRKVKLPDDAQQLLTAALHSQKPVAVFVDSTCASAAAFERAAYWPWYTCNAPEQLLPVAEVWQQGLCAAGWDVLVLQDAHDDAEDREL
jgi:hypothetical protein